MWPAIVLLECLLPRGYGPWLTRTRLTSCFRLAARELDSKALSLAATTGGIAGNLGCLLDGQNGQSGVPVQAPAIKEENKLAQQKGVDYARVFKANAISYILAVIKLLGSW